METSDAISGLRALADQTRIQVARLLVEGSFNVGEIQEVLGLGQSLTSLAQILAPPLGGFLLGREALGAWALVAASAAALGMLASRWGSGRHATHPAPHAAHPRA